MMYTVLKSLNHIIKGARMKNVSKRSLLTVVVVSLFLFIGCLDQPFEDDLDDAGDVVDSILSTLIAENTIIAVKRPLGDTIFNVKYTDGSGGGMKLWLQDSTVEGSVDNLHVGDSVTFYAYSVMVTETSDTAESYDFFRPVIASLHNARYKDGTAATDFTFEWIVNQPYWYPNGPDTIITMVPELLLPDLKKAQINPYSIGVNIYAPTDTLMGNHGLYLVTQFRVAD